MGLLQRKLRPLPEGKEDNVIDGVSEWVLAVPYEVPPIDYGVIPHPGIRALYQDVIVIDDDMIVAVIDPQVRSIRIDAIETRAGATRLAIIVGYEGPHVLVYQWEAGKFYALGGHIPSDVLTPILEKCTGAYETCAVCNATLRAQYGLPPHHPGSGMGDEPSGLRGDAIANDAIGGPWIVVPNEMPEG